MLAELPGLGLVLAVPMSATFKPVFQGPSLSLMLLFFLEILPSLVPSLSWLSTHCPNTSSSSSAPPLAPLDFPGSQPSAPLAFKVGTTPTSPALFRSPGHSVTSSLLGPVPQVVCVPFTLDMPQTEPITSGRALRDYLKPRELHRPLYKGEPVAQPVALFS